MIRALNNLRVRVAPLKNFRVIAHGTHLQREGIVQYRPYDLSRC